MKTTQEQLAKEKETVKKLQEQLDKSVSILAMQGHWLSTAGGKGLGLVLEAQDS